MLKLRLRRDSLSCRVLTGLLVFAFAVNALANPTGMTVGRGSATVRQSGSQLTVTASQNAFLNWKTFNIANGETTTFVQPSSTSVVWNKINDPNPSQIFGTIQANGVVVLLNSSGFYFGPDSFVSAAGLVVSTANYAPPENSGGGWEFNGPPPLASIINYGHIQVGNGGSAFLIADKVENHGTIEAPGGSIGLVAGQTVLLSERPDGRGMSLQVTLPQGSVDNSGNLIADAGTIALNAKVVNQSGVLQANSVREQNGVIELVASDSLTLGAGSKILAQGDAAAPGSPGGSVTLKSDGTFSDAVSSTISTAGGALGGNGGNVEVSAPNISSLNSSMDAGAQSGWLGGIFLIDPVNIILGTSGDGVVPASGTVAANDGTGTLYLDVNTAFANKNFSTITLQATSDITLDAGTVWDLSGSTGMSSGQLTMQAGGNITFGNGSKITAADKWSVTLDAGYDFENNAVQSGQGNIYLNGGSGQAGTGSIQTSQAAVKLTAGDGIFIASGSQLIDDGGYIGLYAQLLSQNGLIQANSVGGQHGTIEVVTSDSLSLGANSKITANGDNSVAGSDGGQIMLQTARFYSDNAGSQIQFRGGVNGGNGGRVLIYAGQSSVKSLLDGFANAGFSAGQQYYYSRADTSDLTLTADSLAPFAGFSSILFQTSGNPAAGSGNITLSPGEVLDLSGSTGSGIGQLILQASGNVLLNDGSQIFDANNWAVTLQAGYNFANNTVTTGTGSITIDGLGSIQTKSGAISLTAGQNISAGDGYIITTGSGGIMAHALSGDIDTGSFAQGYTFHNSASSLATAYDLSGGLGGISTAAGGSVSLTAGGNVSSYLPTRGGSVSAATAGAGAYGPQQGDVTVVAGGNVTGNYVVANGTGSIFAGVKMDASGNPIKDALGNFALGITGSAGTDPQSPNLALNLVKGGWNVTAAQNIILQEVRNPNGVFDVNSGAAYKHYFDYAPDDYVNLTAGNMVQLGANSGVLPRVDNQIKVPVVYPSILNVSAGAGGVTLVGDSFYNQLILFASAQGSLSINTTAGGSLIGKLPNSANAAQLFSLIVSDSAKKQYKTSGDFGLNDHAPAPIHVDNATPITMDIAGDMSLILIGAPEAAQITVRGNMNNSRFQGMNLAAGDTTSITVLGDINDRGDFTTIDLSQNPGTAAPDLASLAQAADNTINGKSVSAADLIASIFYDPTTQKLTYKNISGIAASKVFALLQNLTIQTGYDNFGNPIIKTGISIINASTAGALQNQYNSDNATSGIAADTLPPDNTSGFLFGGGGTLSISARNMDLGTTAGILSLGGGLYLNGSGSPLAQLFNKGADIFVTTTGDMDMFSSSIASLNGGKIEVSAGQDVNVGSADFTDNSIGARGIYSTSGSDVAVFADRNININGSRIAAFDGGNVTVESFNGDINAGVGGLGGVTLVAYYVDPVTHALSQNSSVAFGSGILAETFGPRSGSLAYGAPVNPLGNVLVETPNGNVNANSAGVLQLAFNQEDYPDATVEVLAGYELRDGDGNPLRAGQIAGGTPVLISDNRNIDASNSGIIAQNAILKATGDIEGAIFAKGNIDVNAVNNANVTALAQGTVNASAGGDLSGTIIGIGGITASGANVDAALLSNNSISGATSGQTGFTQGTAANATSQADQSTDVAKAAEEGTGDDSDDEKKKKKPVALAQKVSRVTVLLPTKTN